MVVVHVEVVVVFVVFVVASVVVVFVIVTLLVFMMTLDIRLPHKLDPTAPFRGPTCGSTESGRQ